MIRMTQDALLDKLEQFDDFPDPSHKYGITESDIQKMESNPEKYLDFVMYLLSRDYYAVPGEFQFTNEDALNPKDAAKRLNALINNSVELI